MTKKQKKTAIKKIIRCIKGDVDPTRMGIFVMTYHKRKPPHEKYVKAIGLYEKHEGEIERIVIRYEKNKELHKYEYELLHDDFWEPTFPEFSNKWRRNFEMQYIR